MTEQTKKQVIKSLAYDTDIDSIIADEVNAEKAYYKEMGYISE